MKQKHHRRLALIISTICIGTPLHAADITWDTAATAGIQGGAGTWGAFTTNWTSDDGVTRLGWDNATFAADTALFTTGTGRVTVDGTINLKGITHTSSDTSSIGGRTISYVLEGAGSFNFGSQQGAVNTMASGLTNLQINNNLIGSGGLSIDGANAPTTGNGYTALAGTNTGLTGGITVENGLLGVNGLGSLGTNAVTLNGNAGLFGPINIAGPAATAIDGPGSLTLTVPVSVNGTGNVLRVWGGRTLTLSAALTGSGDASKSDTGLLVLSNATGYSGVITQVAGSTSVSGNFGGSISAATGNVTVGGSVAGNLNLTGAANVNVAGNINGNLTLAGGGDVNLGGNLAGTLTFTQGRLNLGGSFTGEVAVTNTNSGLILGPVGVITGNITTQFNHGQSLVIEGQVNGNVAVEELVATRLNGAEITGNLTLGFDSASTQTRATVSGDTVAVGGDLKVNGSVTLQIDGTIPSGTPILTFSNLITDTANPADHITVVAPPSFTNVVVTFNSGNIVVTYTPGPLALTWDISSAPDIQIGAGTWSTLNNNWTYDGGTTNSFWTNGSHAIFLGSPVADLNVTIEGALSANNVSRSGTNAIRLNTGDGNSLAVNGTVDVAANSRIFFIPRISRTISSRRL
jgi:fibronectin-binding autotransporter adhesin